MLPIRILHGVCSRPSEALRAEICCRTCASGPALPFALVLVLVLVLDSDTAPQGRTHDGSVRDGVDHPIARSTTIAH